MAMKSSVSTSSSAMDEIEIFHEESDGFLCLSSVIELEETDLSYWEFINPSDADSDDGGDDDDEVDVDNISLDSLQNALFVTLHPYSTKNPESEREILTVHLDDLDRDEEKPGLDDLGGGSLNRHVVSYVGNQYVDDDGGEYHDDDDDDDDMDDEDHGYGLDDELVPWSVSGKLGRQRMRKLGKRACAKMNYSKKSPYLYKKPGCVHGKHGLGLKHNF